MEATNAQLLIIRNNLCDAANISPTHNMGEEGYWADIAVALETLASAAVPANSNMLGCMRRAAEASETLMDREISANVGYFGYLYRIVLALEDGGAAGIGSLANRLVLISDDVGSITPPSPLTAPILSLGVGATTYPPEFICEPGTEFAVGDIMHLERSASARFSSILSDDENEIDLGEATAREADFNLSAISSGTYYYRARAERAGNFSDYSNTVIHGAAEDATPAAFSFVDQTGVTAGATITSASVTPSGFNVPVTISVSGGSYAIDSGSGFGSYVTTPGTFYPGDIVRARHTASASPATNTDTVVTIGGVSDTFRSTTASSFTSPTDDATAVHWYDASNETTGVTGSGATLSLRDLIGTHHLTTDSGNAPVTGDATKDVNSHNTIYFDGTKKLWVPAASGIVFPETFHLFFVWYHDPTVYAQAQIITIGDYGDSNPQFSVGDIGGGTGVALRVTNTGMGFTAFNRTAGAPSTGVHLMEVWATDNGTLSLSIDGETAQNAAGTYTGFGGANVSLQLFNRAGAVECSGRACELVLCNAVRSGSNRSEMVNYLKTKWGTP